MGPSKKRLTRNDLLRTTFPRVSSHLRAPPDRSSETAGYTRAALAEAMALPYGFGSSAGDDTGLEWQLIVAQTAATDEPIDNPSPA
jgi:hypothetical protein